MATLEERIQNLTQDINPLARRMTEQEVMEARQRDPMAARFGSANTGFYTDEPKVLSNDEKVTNTLVQLAMNAENPEETEKLLQMIRRRNQALLSGVQDPMMSNVDTSVMQPLVDLGFEQQVRTIMTYPQNSPESMQAQQEILNEMGTGMDVDAFVQTVKEVAPKEIQEEILQDRMMPVSGEGDEGIMALMSAGRNEDTTVGHLAEGDVVVPPEVLEANPSIIDELEDTMLNMGVDPRSRIVDTTGELGGIASINPDTGLQEFFIKKALSKLNRARKKVTKALAPVVSVAAPFIPGVGPLAKAAITAAAGKASGLSTKDALLGGALSYGGSKLFANNPLNPSAGTVPKGNFFSKIGEYVMPGKDGIGLLGNLGKSASGAYEYIMPGKDNVGLFGNVKSGISGLFNRTPESDIIKYDPVNQGYINIKTGMPATASEIASLTTQSNLGRIEDVAKMLTGDDGMTRTEELLAAGYTPEAIKAAKADGTFNALVAQARAEGKVPGRGAVGAIQNVLTGGTQAGGDQGGLGMMGKLGIAGLAGLIGKLAYEEAKDQKGVPLTPLTQMDPLGRYNIEAEIARRTGAEMPSRVEFGLTPEGMPALSGGRPTVTEGMVYQPPEKRMMARGGIMNLSGGGSTGFAERMEVADKLIDSLIPTRKETGAVINEDERSLLNRYSIDRVVEAVPFVPNFIENLIQSDKYKDFESATMDFITPALRQESGAATTYDEINAMKESLIPMPGDTEEVIEAKSMARKNIINKMRSMNSDTQEPNKTKVVVPQRRYGGILNLSMGGMPRYNFGGGVQYFNQGGTVAMAEGGDMDVAINVEEFPVRDGQINGAGTETSDDIPAMLSDGEFVMTAKAVRGAGSFDVNNNNGILTLTPNGEPTRESGTRVMYKLMEHFGKVA